METKRPIENSVQTNHLVTIVTPSERLLLHGPWNIDDQEISFKKSLKDQAVNLDFLITLDNSNNLIHPADISHIEQVIAEMHRGKSVPYHCRIINAQGQVKTLHGFGGLHTAETKTSTSILYDTEEVYKKLHLKIFEPAEHVTPENILEVVFHTFRTAIGVFTAIRRGDEIADFKWILANEKMLSISGYSDLTNKLYSEVFEDFSNACSVENFKHVVETGIPFTCEGTSIRDGKESEKWFSVMATKLGDGFVLHLDDITERKTNERKIKEGSQLLHATLDSLRVKNQELKSLNEELTNFAYTASHDLREPIRKIQVFSERITTLEAPNLSEKGKETFKRIVSAVNRMHTLIDNILSFSKIQATTSPPTAFSLTTVLNGVLQEVNELIQQRNARIEYNDLGVFKGNEAQFTQLLQNLLTNALTFQKPGNIPVVRITTDYLDGKDIEHPNVVSRKKYLRLEVADNGIGFEQEYASRIFQMFQRLQGSHEYTGSGMGLSICKKIVEKHKGFILAKGKPGQGAVFTCYFPLPYNFKPEQLQP